MLIDEINVAKWFRVKSPSFKRCKQGDLPLLNFSNLTCMVACPWGGGGGGGGKFFQLTSVDS